MVSIFGASIYLMAQNLGIELKLDKFPDINIEYSTIEQIFSSISNILLGDSNPELGLAIVGGGALVVGFIVYRVRVALRVNRNLKEATRLYEESKIYAHNIRDYIDELIKIGEHIEEIIPTIKGYGYLLDEHIARLKRAIYIEGEKDSYRDYHSTTVDTIKDTRRIMKQIDELLKIPIVGGDGGK